MKKIYFLFIALYSTVSFSQSSSLLNETWYLEKLVIDEVDSFPPASPTVPYVILTFFDQTSFSTAVCNAGYGLIQFVEGNTFTIGDGNFNVTLIMCQNPLDEPFEYLYLFDYFMYNTSGAFSYSVINMDNGLKKLTVTNDEGNLAIYYNQNLDSISFEKEKWSFYPNPTKDILYFKNENIQISTIEIYDVLGKLCIKKTIDATNKSVTTEGLIKGVYLIKIFNEQEIFSSKFIKE